MATGRRDRIDRETCARWIVRFALLLAWCGYALSNQPPAAAAGPVAQFGRVTVEEGLPHGAVSDMAQDAQGFLWFASQGGLCRFDGYDCQIFPLEDDLGSDAPVRVFTLETDYQGQLWAATPLGVLARFDPPRQRFEPHVLRDASTGTVLEAPMSEILADHRGYLWVATGQGIWRYDPTSRQAIHLSPSSEPPVVLSDNRVGVLAEDLHGNVWIGTYQGLFRLDPDSFELEAFYADPQDSARLQNDLINAIEPDADGGLWIGTAQGLFHLDPVTHRARPFKTPEADLSTLRIFSLHRDSHDDLWVGTANDGIYRLARDGSLQGRFEATGEPQGLVGNRVRSIFEDSHNRLWFTTYVGVSSFDPRQQQFGTWRQQTGAEHTLRGNSISSLLEDSSGHLWVGTWDKGLHRIDRAAGRIAYFPSQPQRAGGLPDATITALLERRNGSLWIGTWGGLATWRPEDATFSVHRHRPEAPDSLVNDAIQDLAEDAAQRLWVVTVDGVDRLESDGESFHHLDLEGDAGTDFRAVAVDHQGIVWLGSESGLWRHDEVTDVLHPWPWTEDRDSGCALGLAHIIEDPQGNLWFGSQEGFGRLDQERRRMRCWRLADGMISDDVLAVVGDDDGKIWLTTNSGLSRFDPETEVFTHFGADDGLQSKSFSYGSVHRNRRGELFFGGIRGFNAFFPSDVSLDPDPPTLHVEQVLIQNRPISPAPEDNAYIEIRSEGNHDSPRRHLRLTHRDTMVTFELLALHYAAPESNRYAYRLDGFDTDWIEGGSEKRFATYTNLPSGNYALHIRGSNKDGVWSEEVTPFSITVVPPPWRSPWAYALYVAALLAIAANYVRKQQKKLRMQTAIAEKERAVAQGERAVSQRLREVDRFKDEFLAKTSHELRTPLFGITGLAESLLDGTGDPLPATAQRDLSMIVSSGRRLSSLVNDLLDSSRLVGGSIQLQRKAVDLHALVDVVLSISRPLAGDKPVELVNGISSQLPLADGDENRLGQILHNLVSNAIKFTERGVVKVSGQTDGDQLILSVKDTGLGIAAEHHEKIFRSFEQAEDSIERRYGGTGLGLAITRQLVELHGGNIWLESQPGQGSSFSFSLPQASESTPRETEPVPYQDTGPTPAPLFLPLVEEASKAPGPVVHSSEEAPSSPHGSILVVDDEPVVRQVLVNHLSGAGYTVRQAADGHEALRHLEEQELDLVLLDVMMPRLSGYEVCRRIRWSRDLQDLPVLFLTAKSQSEDRLAGLSAGANDYLNKPIDRDELLARVRLHLHLRRMHLHLEELVAERAEQLKVLRGMLPICSQCKKVRDDEGYWADLETYICEHSEAVFSHSLCQSCAEDLYPELEISR